MANVLLKTLTFLLVLLIASCTPPKVFTEARQKVLDHKKIAILPSIVVFESNQALSQSKLVAEEMEYSLEFQSRIHKKIQKKVQRNKSGLSIQATQETNKLLGQAGYFDDEEFTSIELCKILDVDGILFSEFLLYYINGTKGCCLYPVYNNEKEIVMYMEILDKEEEEPVFVCEHSVFQDYGDHYPSKWMKRDIIRIGVSSLPYFKYQVIK